MIDESMLTPNQQAVINAIREQKRPMNGREIYEATGEIFRGTEATFVYLYNMWTAKLLVRQKINGVFAYDVPISSTPAAKEDLRAPMMPEPLRSQVLPKNSSVKKEPAPPSRAHVVIKDPSAAPSQVTIVINIPLGDSIVHSANLLKALTRLVRSVRKESAA